jgi:hypothetical protein
MKKCLAFTLLACVLFGCKGKKTSASGTVEVDVHDFIARFKSVKLPYQVSDTVLSRGNLEALQISRSEFEQFIPDSLISRSFGKTGRPRFYAGARVSVKNAETYLFAKAVSATKKLFYVLVLNKENQFVTGMPLINPESGSGISWQLSMDSKYTVSITKFHKSSDGPSYYNREAYVYNDEGVFTLILTESNQSISKNLQIINPIDTLPRKHKFTGDYIQDKRNLISVRDAKDPAKLQIFVHFEKDNGECKGELKGEIRFINPNMAQYHSNSDPCAIQFTFTPAEVTMKELQACGNHRDIKCFFEGVYERKKDMKAKPQKKKSRK